MRAAILVSLLAVACTDKDDVGDDTGSLDDTGETDSAEECDVTVTVFDYDDQASWSMEAPDCSGTSQSPIDLDTTLMSEGEAPILDFAYTTTPLHAINNGHSIEYEVDADANTLTVDGADYALLQFHFHAPSEHTVDGVNADMEMHLVHKDANNALAVVSILIFEDTEQSWIDAASWAEVPVEAGECLEDASVTLDMDDLISSQLIGKTQDVVHYTGSLTTPPCSEEVEWYILGQYLTLSAAQIATFTDIYFGNNRDVQDRNDRDLIYDGSYGK